MRSERQLFLEAHIHLKKAKQHAEHELDSEVVQDAVAMRLVAMLDTLGRLPEDTLANYFGSEWPAMRGMRNRIVHGYMSIDPVVIRLTVAEDLPGIDARIRAAIDELPAL